MARMVKGSNGGQIKIAEPGESGNPNGKPKGTRNIATVLREYLEALDKERGGTGEALNIPTAELIRLISAKNEAVRLKAIQEAYDRLEGETEKNINLNNAIPKIEIKFRNAD